MTFSVFNLHNSPPLMCGESDTGAYLTMNRNLLFLMAILVTASTNVLAQRGGVAGLGRGSAPRPMSTTRPRFSRNSDRRWRDRSDFGDYNRYSDLGGLYPDYYGDYWGSSLYGHDDYLYGHDDHYDFHPDVALVTPAQEPVSPPPPPATPVVLEYSWPDSGSGSATAFAIVSKDGTVHRALAVWLQDESLCFTTPQGIGQQLPLTQVDGKATTRINAELKLKLPMPLQDSYQDGPINGPGNGR
jgi:hypothetical protein